MAKKQATADCTMDPETICRLSLVVLWAAYFAIRLRHLGFRHRPKAEKTPKNKKRAEGIVFLFILIGIYGSGILYLVNPWWLKKTGLPLPTWLRLAALPLAASSLVLLQWAHSHLGNNWSYSTRLRENHSLIQTGPFHFVRHPVYAAVTLFCLSLAVLAANGLVAGSTAALILFLLLRIPREEALLASRFGQAYRNYQRRTGRLLPRLPGKKKCKSDL